MAGRSTPNPNAASEMDMSMDLSSIQPEDPLQAKLDDLMELTRKNSEQLSKLLGESSRSKQQRQKRKAAVPRVCSAAVRRTYNSIQGDNAWTFDDSFLAPENQQTTNVVIDEVVKECGDKYTKDEIREGCKIYWRSQRDKHQRLKKGTNEDHLKRVKRNYRLSTKLSNRKGALEKTDWELRKKEKVLAALTVDYMSSEEDGEGEDLGTIVVVPLSWESAKLKKYKEHLDRLHLEGCSRSALSLQKKRKRKDSCSRREQPKGAPAWLLKNSESLDEYTFTD